MASRHDLFIRADQLFDEALNLSPGERPAFLAAACGEDQELRALLDRLLAATQADDMVLAPGGGASGPLLDQLVDELDSVDSTSPGTLVGRYRVVRELGRGGMAVVYLAERADGQFSQKVALKLIKRGIDTDDVVRRFDLERQILALAGHPNIARLLDGGVGPDGLPFFAMEYVEGQPIDQYCDRLQLTVKARLQLFLQIAQAVGYAHRNLVVHRDIKPSNILVDQEGQAKLLDFGIAKLLDPEAATHLTRTDTRLMTPMFASPEQVRGGQVTTASDVYQLGLLLYMLLTGCWPYPVAESEALAVARAIAQAEPSRPSTVITRKEMHRPGESEIDSAAISEARSTTLLRLQRELAGDLDRILLMALRKEPERRYGSVAQLIDDIERYLQGRPVAARADTLVYRVSKFVRRNAAASLTAAAALVLIVALAVYYTLQLTWERDRARRAAAHATRVSEFLRGLFAVSAPTRSKGEAVTARQLLDRGAWQVVEGLEGQPELQADMMILMGDVYRELAHFAEAKTLLDAAVRLRREAPGEDALGLAAALFAQARLNAETGEPGSLATAARILGEVLRIRQHVLGPDHPEVARVLAESGRVFMLQGNYEAARQDQEHALAILEARLGPDDAEVGLVLMNLGEVLIEVREFEVAKQQLERAINILGRVYEPDHPHIANALALLANALRFTNDLAGARAQYEGALVLVERAYGPEHPRFAEVLNQRGLLLNASGDPAAAIADLERALAIRKKAFGEIHAKVAASLNNLGLVYRSKRDSARARRYFEQSVAVYEAALGHDHVDVATPLRNLAEILKQVGPREEAVPLYQRVIKIREQSFGPNHSLLASPLGSLGELELDLGNPRVAEPLLRRALALGRDHEPHRVPEVVRPRIALGRCLTALGRFPEAEELLLATTQETDVIYRRQAYRGLIALYQAWGRPQDAARQQQALAALEQKSKPRS